MNAVDTLSITVNNTMKNEVDRTITSGLYRFCAPRDDQRITGNTGSTHGARTLSIQAKNESISNDMRERLRIEV